VAALDAEALDLVRFEMLAWTSGAAKKTGSASSPERVAPLLRREWREKIGHFAAVDFMPADVAAKAAAAHKRSLYDPDASAAVQELHDAVNHLLDQVCDGATAWRPFTIGLGATRQPDGTILRDAMLGPEAEFYDAAIRVLVDLGPRLRRCARRQCAHPFAATRVDQRYCSPRCRTATYDRKEPLRRARQKLDSRRRQRRVIDEVLGDAISARVKRGRGHG
jgi:hypothetical protein